MIAKEQGTGNQESGGAGAEEDLDNWRPSANIDSAWWHAAGGGSLHRIFPVVLVLAALGTGLLTGSNRAVASGVTVTAIAAGNAHACAVTTSGGVECWGSNLSGSLGDGTQTLRTTPVDVCQTYDEPAQRCTETLSGIVGVAAGAQHTCAITTAGGVKCWGWNRFGQLGTGQEVTCLSKGIIIDPVPASADLIEGPCSNTPVEVTGLSDAVAIVAGSYHNCALTKSGAVKCWGQNYAGHLGDGTMADRRTPVDVCDQYDDVAQECTRVLSGVAAIAAGWNYTCAVASTGAVRCWGSNELDQLGAETDEFCTDPAGRVIDCSTTPVQMRGFETGMASVALATGSTCAVTTAGGVKCRGGNGLGGLGDGGRCGTVCSSPVDVDGMRSGIVAVAAGAGHTCALTHAGAVKCWGLNHVGQLGRETVELCGFAGDLPCSRTPVSVISLGRGANAVAGGQFFTCALTGAGGVKCWGDNCCGQLGNSERDDPPGIIVPHPTPVRVVGLGPKAPGDADCTGAVTSIDAALVLQFDAGMLASLGCPDNADASQDGRTNSADAALILQHVAGLFTL